MSQLGHSRPNEAIDFESALTSTPDISLHRTKGREGPIRDIDLAIRRPSLADPTGVFDAAVLLFKHVELASIRPPP
jgi:hypothetical protein